MNTLLIRQKMIERGLTQEDVARACGLERKAIQRILSGLVKKPHKETIKAISRCLEIPLMELIENKTEISRKKLLEIMLTRFGVHSEFDYFIFGKADKLEPKDVKSLINDFGINISYIALGKDEVNRVEFDEGNLLIYAIDNNLDYEAIYLNKEKALKKTDYFVKFSKSILRCRPLDACKLLKTSRHAGRLFIDFNAVKMYSRYKGLSLDILEKKLKQTIADLPDSYLQQLKNKPLDGVLDAKVLSILTDELGVRAKELLYPEWLR